MSVQELEIVETSSETEEDIDHLVCCEVPMGWQVTKAACGLVEFEEVASADVEPVRNPCEPCLRTHPGTCIQDGSECWSWEDTIF